MKSNADIRLDMVRSSSYLRVQGIINDLLEDGPLNIDQSTLDRILAKTISGINTLLHNEGILEDYDLSFSANQ